MTTDARLRHPWLRINRVLRAMLHERWSADAWPQVKAEFKKALALKSQIRRRLVQLAAVARRPEKRREYCGELDSAVENDRVWMTCTCGAVIVRVLESAPRAELSP